MTGAAEIRRRLPNRRGHELLSFEHGGIHYTAGVGRFENGDLAEIFLNTRKHGTAIDVNARDAAVAASLLLQQCDVDTLRKALTRNSDGSASGPLARVLDLLVTEQQRTEHFSHLGSGGCGAERCRQPARTRAGAKLPGGEY